MAAAEALLPPLLPPLAHATQIDPDGPWFAIPREIQQKTWPTEDYELARSFVDAEVPEDDLFAGIRGRDDLDI